MLRSVRQLSFFVTTAESETVSRHQKSVYVSVLSLGSSLSSRRNYYSTTLLFVLHSGQIVFEDMGIPTVFDAWLIFVYNFVELFLQTTIAGKHFFLIPKGTCLRQFGG